MKPSKTMAENSDPPYSFTYPPEWSDRERMHYLLAPIPPNKTQTANDPKIAFWSKLIASSSKELKRPTFTERELLARFRWNQVTSPSCLSSVVSSMEKAGEVTRMSEIRQSVRQLQEVASGGWMAWGVGLMKAPVNWALKGYFSSGPDADEEYVVVSAIKELATKVMTEHQKRVEYQSTDRVINYSCFVELCKHASGAAESENLTAIELWLLKERKIVKAKSGSREIVKFCSKVGECVTETDIGILSIKNTIDSLSQQVCQLQKRTTELKQRAVEQFKAKNKKGAVALLRQQKVMDASLAKREGTLDNLQNILHQIQMAETDILVYEAYKRGSEALKHLRESSGISVDDIDDLAANLDDALEANQEISNAMSQVGQPVGEEDITDELEAELASLLETEQTHVAAAKLSPTKEAESADDEQDLEARLAALSLGGRTKPPQVTTNREERTTDQLRPSDGKVSRTPTKKLTPIPA